MHEKHGLHAGKMSNNPKVKVKYAFLKFTDNKSQSNGRCLDSRKPYTLFFSNASQNLNVLLVLLMKRWHVPFRESKFTRIPWGEMQRRNSTYCRGHEDGKGRYTPGKDDHGLHMGQRLMRLVENAMGRAALPPASLRRKARLHLIRHVYNLHDLICLLWFLLYD